MVDWEPYKALIEVLSNDLIAAGQELNQPDLQLRRRTLFRAFFAQVEGETSLRKEFALLQHAERQTVFSEPELAMLREEQYVLANNGEVRVQPKFLRLTDNLRFSFKAFAKAFGSSFELEVSGSGWDAFQRSIIVRNRITHPKTLTDLTVSDSAKQGASNKTTLYFPFAPTISCKDRMTRTATVGCRKLHRCAPS